jgi:hypothetical protein
MSTRKISFKLLTQQQLEVVETSARTFGELKAEISQNRDLTTKMSNFSGVQFIEKRTLVEYGKLDDAVLPAIDCILFVQPLQTKSGATNYKEMGYNALRTFVATLNKNEGAAISLTGSKDDIFARVDEYYNDAASASNEDNGNVVDWLKNAVSTINTCIEVLEENDEVEVTKVHPVILVTEEDLDIEAKKINSILNKK